MGFLNIFLSTTFLWKIDLHFYVFIFASSLCKTKLMGHMPNTATYKLSLVGREASDGFGTLSLCG
jgi:hypothetical protein